MLSVTEVSLLRMGEVVLSLGRCTEATPLGGSSHSRTRVTRPPPKASLRVMTGQVETTSSGFTSFRLRSELEESLEVPSASPPFLCFCRRILRTHKHIHNPRWKRNNTFVLWVGLYLPNPYFLKKKFSFPGTHIKHLIWICWSSIIVPTFRLEWSSTQLLILKSIP